MKKALLDGAHKQTFPEAYILGLKRQRPLFVVVPVTEGDLRGYSESIGLAVSRVVKAME
jgi:hypothetical protein